MWTAIATAGRGEPRPRSDSQYGLGGFAPVLQANRDGIQEGISSDNELSYGHDLITEIGTIEVGKRRIWC
jgi:5-methylthioadenosine/S-adenosylhomocysteine deaminase